MKAKTNPNRAMKQVTVPMTPEILEEFKKVSSSLAFPNAASMIRTLAFYYGLLHPEKASWEEARLETNEYVQKARRLISDNNAKYAKGEKE